MKLSRYILTSAALWACASCLAFAATAGATSAWLAPQTLSATGADAKEADVAMTPSGEAVAIWVRSDGHNTIVEAASRPVGGGWSQPTQISEPGKSATEPRVAIDPAGDVTAVWSRGENEGSDFAVETASRSQGGGWGQTKQLSATGLDAEEPQIAIDPAGEAVAVWREQEGMVTIIAASAKRPGGDWSTAEKLPAPAREPDETSSEPRVAIDQDGEAVAIWARFDENDIGSIEGSSRPAGQRWAAATEVTPLKDDSEGPALAIGPEGEAVAAWINDHGHSGQIEASSRAAGGGWVTPTQLSAASNAGEPSVAVDAAKEAVVVWPLNRGAGESVIESASRTGSGVWSTPTELSPPGRPGQAEVATDPAGEAVAVWIHRDIGGAPASHVVESASAQIRGAWSSATTVSAAGPSVSGANVAIDADGEALATWTRSDGMNTLVEAASFNRLPPGPGRPSGAGTSNQPGGAPGAGEARATRVVAVRGKFALLKLTCPGPSTVGCQGVAKLTAKGPKPKRRTLVLARGAFRVPGGKVATVKLKLSLTAVQMLAAHASLKAGLLGTGLVPRSVLLKPKGR